MRSLPILAILTALAGCQACATSVPDRVEANVSMLAPPPIALQPVAPEPPRSLDLPALWDLALVYNPALREAAADVEAARGRLIQAKLYPNPHVLYDQDTIGSRIASQGNISVQVQQEVVTAGKRKLGMAVAARETDVATLALVGRKFEVMTRVRRAYFDYVGYQYMVRANKEVVAFLERGLETTRKLVEQAKTRPRSDVLRTEALLQEAQISLARSEANLAAAWRRLAAEVGVPSLPPAESIAEPPPDIPQWESGEILNRVLTANSELRQAAADVERARVAAERARAQVVPNVTVGGGYVADNVDQTAGGLVTVETALPVWDRNQGNIYTAQAELARTQAVVRGTQTRLQRDTATAYAAYEATRQQVNRLTAEVLPRLEESLELVRKGYQAGAADFTFSDVLMAEQSLFTARVTLAEARRNLWLAVADLQGLMQLDIGEELQGMRCEEVPLSRVR